MYQLEIDDQTNGIINFHPLSDLCEKKRLKSAYSLTYGTNKITDRISMNKGNKFILCNISHPIKIYFLNDDIIIETYSTKYLIEKRILFNKSNKILYHKVIKIGKNISSSEAPASESSSSVFKNMSLPESYYNLLPESSSSDDDSSDDDD